MDVFQLVLATIRGLSVVTNNPALGGGSSVRLQEVSELLNLFATLVEAGEEGYTELEAFADQIRSMAAEGREPSRAEWDSLRARSDSAHDTIQDALAAAEAEETTEDSDTLEEPPSVKPGDPSVPIPSDGDDPVPETE